MIRLSIKYLLESLVLHLFLLKTELPCLIFFQNQLEVNGVLIEFCNHGIYLILLFFDKNCMLFKFRLTANKYDTLFI